jgi:hypothetical protein
MSQIDPKGNVADVYLKDGKYYCYLNGKKLCQSKRILDIEMLLLVKKWTQKAKDANIVSLKFHFDERAARDAETPVTKVEKPSDKFIITRDKNTITVISNDDAEPDRQMIPKDHHDIRREAHRRSSLRRFLQQNRFGFDRGNWFFSHAGLQCSV